MNSADLPSAFDGFKIALVSDLHGKSFGKDNSALVKMLNDENPDMIVFAGDMLTYSDDDTKVFYSLVEALAGKYDMYYSYGNHEGRLDIKEQIDLNSKLSAYGVHILNNACTLITRDDQTIYLYGLDLPGYMYSSADKNGSSKYAPTKQWLDITLGPGQGADDGSFKILIAHTPLYFDQYADWGADLVLSGHIHGGEVRIPFVGGVFSPHDEFFPKYDAGEFDLNSSKLIVSRGLGEHAFPVRFFNPADLCIITLHTPEN